MRIKFILTFIITLFTLQIANAQQTETYTTLDVVRLVTDANFKLNTIYRNRVSGLEQEQAALRKAIYAANGELLEIRGMLTGGNRINDVKLNSIQRQVSALQESMTVVCDSLSDNDMLNSVKDVGSKAKILRKIISKI